MKNHLIIGVPDIANVPEMRAALAEYGLAGDDADALFRIAAEFGIKSEPVADGYITVRYHKLSRFSLEDHTGITHGKRVAKGPATVYTQEGDPELPSRYSSGKAATMRRKEMPARGRKPAAAPAPVEPTVEEVDYQFYIDKDLTATMRDYVEWFEKNVSKLNKLDEDKILTLGVSLYSHFQKSDFNVDRREARRAEREAAAEAPPEPEPAAPARGRGRRAPAATAPANAAPARSGRPARGRRPAAAAAAGTPDAPF